jgi:hypothetical protein
MARGRWLGLAEIAFNVSARLPSAFSRANSLLWKQGYCDGSSIRQRCFAIWRETHDSLLSNSHDVLQAANNSRTALGKR